MSTKLIMESWRKYVRILSEEEASPAPAAPSQQIQFSGETELAKSKYATTRQFGVKCPLADKTQKLILSKIKITDKNLIRKLSDGKMGYITASLINYAIDYAAKNNIQKIAIRKIALNPAGYSAACDSTPSQIQGILNILGIIPLPDIQNIVIQKDKEKTGEEKPGEVKTTTYQKAPPVLVPMKTTLINTLRTTLKNPAEAEKYADTIMQQYFPAKLKASPYRTVEELAEAPKAIPRLAREMISQFIKDFPGVVSGEAAAQQPQQPAQQTQQTQQTTQRSVVQGRLAGQMDGTYIFTTADNKKVVIPANEIELNEEDMKNAYTNCRNKYAFSLCQSVAEMNKRNAAIRKYAPMAK